MWIGLIKEIRKLTFRALGICRSESQQPTIYLLQFDGIQANKQTKTKQGIFYKTEYLLL